MKMEKILAALLLSIVLSQSAFAQVPGRVMNEIKSIAKLDWPQDYEMQKYNIDKQVKAYKQMSNLYKKGFQDIPLFTVRAILERSKMDWPQDYEMQQYSTKKQIKYYLSIN
jgi:hypothetical protein